MKKLSLKKVNILLFQLVIILKILEYIVADSGGNLNSLYFDAMTVLLILVSGMCLVFRDKGVIKSNLILFSKLKIIFVLCSIYVIFSIITVIKNGGTIQVVTYEGIYHIIFPIIIAFLVSNIYTNTEIYKLIKNCFLFVFCAYIGYWILYSGPHADLYWKGGTSFGNSFSPYESTFFSYWAIGFFIFFNRYDKKGICKWLSFCFVILTFKRFLIVAAILGIIFKKFLNEDKDMLKKNKNALLVGMMVITAVWIMLIFGYFEKIFEMIFHKSFAGFTMSRAFIFQQILKKGFTSYGVFSSKMYAEKFGHWSIEMDIPMIYIELGIVAVFITIVCLWLMIQNKRYNAYIILVTFIQLLTSAWFDYPFYWLFMYLSMACIEKEKFEVMDINNNWLKIKVGDRKWTRIRFHL